MSEFNFKYEMPYMFGVFKELTARDVILKRLKRNGFAMKCYALQKDSEFHFNTIQAELEVMVDNGEIEKIVNKKDIYYKFKVEKPDMIRKTKTCIPRNVEFWRGYQIKNCGYCNRMGSRKWTATHLETEEVITGRTYEWVMTKIAERTANDV
jgi:hypothetical protein